MCVSVHVSTVLCSPQPFFVPAFSVTVTNSSVSSLPHADFPNLTPRLCMQGSQLQMDCSFDEQGHYVEQGNEWDNLTVDAVSVVPVDALNAESVYTASADNLSTVSQSGSLSECAVGRVRSPSPSAGPARGPASIPGGERHWPAVCNRDYAVLPRTRAQMLRRAQP